MPSNTIRIKRRKLALLDKSLFSAPDAAGEYKIELYIAGLDPYRASRPHHIPRPYPHAMLATSQQVIEIVDAIKPRCLAVLQDAGIQHTSIQSRLLVPRTNYPSRDTLIINTDDKDSTRWPRAAEKIQEFLDAEIERRNHMSKISVEVRNPNLMYRDTSSAVIAGSTAHRTLSKIKDLVASLVEKQIPGHTSISFCMRSRIYSAEEPKPTILIGIKPGTKANWENAYESVCAGLEDVSSDGPQTEIAVELMAS